MHNNTRNDTNDSMNFDEFRKSYELPHHWQLRKEFLQLYADKFDIDRLICLSNVFVNVECMGLSYPEGVMKLVKELKTKVRGLEVYKYQYEKDEPEQPRKQMTPNSSLLQWLATFELNGRPAIELKDDAYYNLADGYVSARILNQISPQYFSDNWLDGIKPVPPNGSWRLRVSNLKRILQKIHDYASDLQSSQFRTNAITPDVGVIAQNFDPNQISRLIQLILFCAINCDKKQDYIEKIRNLPTQVKQDIKEAIEELLVRDEENSNQKFSPSQAPNDSANNDAYLDTSGQRFNANSSQSSNLLPSKSSPYRNMIRRDSSQMSSDISKHDISAQSSHDLANETAEEVRQKLITALAIKEEKAQACHELELKLKQLQLEKEQLAYENERLIKERPSTKITDTRRQSRTSHDTDIKDIDNRLKNIEDDSSQNLVLKQNKKLQSELSRLKEDLIKVETEKEEYRLKTSLLRGDLERITLKHDELRHKAEQAKRLQDELDEHRHVSEKIVSYETTIENLVKRNNELKQELKSIEEKNVSHIHKIVRLEEDKNQLTQTINRNEIYMRQLQEARVKLSQETHRADQAEVELTRLTDKYQAIKKENEKLYEATNQLMRSNSTVAQNLPGLASTINDTSASEREVNSDSVRGSPKKKTGTNYLFHGDQGDDLPNSMSSPVIELKEKIARLEYANELLQNKLNSKKEGDQSVLAGLLEASNARCTKLEIDNRQSRKMILLLEGRLKDITNGSASTSAAAALNETSSDNTLALINRVEELQRLLFQKEQELMESESKYKKNLQKAKEVIKTLNNNQSMNSSLHPSCMSSVSFNSSSVDETNVLKQQLLEKQERLIEMEREFLEFKKLKEMHERLIISAFYGLTTPMQWRNAEKRLERTTLTSPPNTASSSLNHPKHSH